MKVITIGRSSKSDVVIRDAFVGRIHMQIVLDNDGSVYAVDLNSTNGTYVNGQRIYGRVRLQKNDIIRIGNTTLPWQNYIYQNASPIGYRNNTILYIIISILLLLLVCAGVYLFRINNANEQSSVEAPQYSEADQPNIDEPRNESENYSINSNPDDLSGHKSEGVSDVTRNKNEKPSIHTIPYDLIGHKLSEGVSDGYHKKDWTYSIENNSITNFSIDEILTDNNSSYLVICSFRLKGGNNFYYDTKAKISYINNDNGWELNYVNSLGMVIVADRQYDDCIICEIADDGWGGVNCLRIRNISECTLVVGGQMRTYNGWLKFSKAVSPHDSGSVGGTFEGGNVQDYRIEFVVREK